MELIVLDKVSYAYPGRPAVLKKVDLALVEGERLGLVGPNGAGKSTLFSLAMGLIAPTGGAVYALGGEPRTAAQWREVRLAVGYCFQDPDDQLFCPTVHEDVAFGPLNQGLGQPVAQQVASRALESLGLGGFESRVTYQLSGGEKRLVSLAAVLAMHPRHLLLDEPTAGLDPATEKRLELALADSGLGWTIISHDHGFLRRTCDRILELSHGGLHPWVE